MQQNYAEENTQPYFPMDLKMIKSDVLVEFSISFLQIFLL